MKKLITVFILFTSNYLLNAQCQAGFGYQHDSLWNVTTLTGSATVSDSSAFPISYTWLLGDGTSDTGQVVTHQYPPSGVYSVCLTIQTANGCSSTVCDSIIIANYTPCSVNYSYLLDSVNTNGSTYSFTNGSVADLGATIVSYNWDFGDSTLHSNLQNPTHTYILPGNYPVCLSIYTSSGCSNVYCSIISVANPIGQCQANFAYLIDSINQGGTTYSYTDTSIPNDSANVVSYFWDFSDGTTSILQNPVHTYTFSGTYSVCLTITTSTGCTSTWCTNMTVTNPSGPCVANAGGHYWPGLFGANSHIKTDTICGLNYQMAAISNSGQGYWYTQNGLSIFNSTGTTTTQLYNDSLNLNCVGCYSVFNSTGLKYYEYIWQENNDSLCTDTLRLYFAPIPSGQFTIEQPACSQNNFTMIAHLWPLPNDIDYYLTGFNWSYPNGIIDSSTTFPLDTIWVSWPLGNQNNVTLITTNIWGCSSSLISQQLPEPYLANITTSSPTTIGGNNGYIESSVSGGTPPYSYSWSTGQTTPNIYNLTSGLYLLNVTDANGCNNSFTAQLFEPYDTTGGPIVDTLITNVLDTCLNFTPDSFNISTVSIDSINNIVTVTWVFSGNGSTSSFTVTYQYYQSGNTAIVLTIDCGTKTLTTYISYIHISASVGIESVDFDKKDILVYPVPFTDVLNIAFTSNKASEINISLFDATGRMVANKKINVTAGVNQTEINTQKISSGVYILNITNNLQTIHKQIVK